MRSTNRRLASGHKGDYDRAIKDYSQALRLNPRDANAFNSRGWAYARKIRRFVSFQE